MPSTTVKPRLKRHLSWSSAAPDTVKSSDIVRKFADTIRLDSAGATALSLWLLIWSAEPSSPTAVSIPATTKREMARMYACVHVRRAIDRSTRRLSHGVCRCECGLESRHQCLAVTNAELKLRRAMHER